MSFQIPDHLVHSDDAPQVQAVRALSAYHSWICPSFLAAQHPNLESNSEIDLRRLRVQIPDAFQYIGTSLSGEYPSELRSIFRPFSSKGPVFAVLKQK
jgi:hypothetical protein